MTYTYIKSPYMHKIYTEGFYLHSKKEMLVMVINDHHLLHAPPPSTLPLG